MQFSSIWLMIRLYQVLPLRPEWTWECSPRLQHYWNLTIREFSVILSGHSLGKRYPSAEIQSVYSAAPADWANLLYIFIYNANFFSDWNLFSNLTKDVLRMTLNYIAWWGSISEILKNQESGNTSESIWTSVRVPVKSILIRLKIIDIR